MKMISDELLVAAAERWKLEIEANHATVPEDYTRNLVEILQKSSMYQYGYAVLRTDFDPDGYLTEAAIKSGMDPKAYPRMTIMRIWDNDLYEVTIKKGYTGEVERVYPQPVNAAN